MSLSLLIILIALAGGCAAIQAASKVRTHRKLSRLHQELDEARAQHVEAIRTLYDRQIELCAYLGRPDPEAPVALLPQPEPEQSGQRRFRLPVRLPFRKKEPILQRAPRGNSATIVGRHGASFAVSAIWKTSSGAIMRVVQPVGARALSFMPRFLSFAPRLAGAGGGATGSIAASTGLRFALSAFSIVGIILGPALAAWCVFSEFRKVRKARHEQAMTLNQFRSELESMTQRTAELETQSPSETLPAFQLT